MPSERPAWKDEAQKFLEPKWGRTDALTVREYFGRPVYGDFGRTHVDSYLEHSEFNLTGASTRTAKMPNRRFDVHIDAQEAREPYYKRAAVLYYRVMEAICPDGKVKPSDMRSVVEAVFVIPQFLVWRSDDPIPNGDVHNVYMAATQMAAGLIATFLNPEFSPTEMLTDEQSIDQYYRMLLERRAFDNDSIKKSCPASAKEVKDGFRGLSLVPDKLKPTDEDSELFAEVLAPSVLDRLRIMGRAEFDIMEMRARTRGYTSGKVTMLLSVDHNQYGTRSKRTRSGNI